MATALNGKAKAMPDTEVPDEEVKDEALVESTDQTDGESAGEGGEEKYSAQVLRRLHRDASLLLEEYEEMREYLEHDDIDDHLQKTMEQLVELLEEREALMSKHHPDLPALEGADDAGKQLDEAEGDEGMEAEGDKSVGEDNEEAVETDSKDEEEVSPDDAIEGMKKKRLTLKQTKALRQHYSKGLKCMKCGKAGCSCTKALAARRVKSGLGVEGSHEPGWEAEKEEGKKDLGIEGSHEPGHEAAKEEKKKKLKDLGVEGSHEPGDEAERETGHKDFPDHTQDEAVGVTEPANEPLMPHEKKSVQEAHSFLKELSEERDFGDTHRLKCYHFHKSLDPIGMGIEDSHVPGNEADHEELASGHSTGVKSRDEQYTPEDAYQDKLKGTQPKPRPDNGDPGKPAKNLKGFDKLKKEDDEVDVTEGKKDMNPINHEAETDFTGGDQSMPDDAVPDSKSMREHRKCIHGASKFFKNLSEERAFGDHHRQEAFHHHKALDPIAQEDEEVNVHEPSNIEPGEIDTKSLNRLKAIFAQNEAEMVKVQKKLNALKI